MAEKRLYAPDGDRPDYWTDLHETIAQALYAQTWTEPKDDDPHPDWHRNFQWWQCVFAAKVVAEALAHNDGEA